jgi:hypothetical protein
MDLRPQEGSDMTTTAFATKLSLTTKYSKLSALA